jgi:hypothetical protein
MSELIRGLNRTLLVNLDYTIMILDPRGYQLVQAGVRSCPNLHSSFSSIIIYSPSTCPLLSVSISSIDDMRELIRGLMEGAAEPGQAQPEDKQGKKMKEIQVEVDLATDAMKDTVLKIQERGQVLDHLQERSGEYFYFDCVRSLETEGDTADGLDSLSISSQSFRTTATKTRRRMFLQNAKVCGRLLSRPLLYTFCSLLCALHSLLFTHHPFQFDSPFSHSSLFTLPPSRTSFRS